MKVISVRFKDYYGNYSGKEYHFYTTLENVQKGDIAVAIWQEQPSICKVHSVDCNPKASITNIITQLVDLETQKQFAQQIKKKNEIQKANAKKSKTITGRSALEHVS